ncbi:hypothetical protein RvY_10994 [Ramazzottius varieornatus]|uniref:Receptor ligand binding region domain-containing protein n=1 Tax=Ramazzottius varieornatus TaxID=947166 RepID=A0A1D1VEM1_RAMVA|nr:hypothetical protein RvY_10994 [Ramazzottius varieornatus]
MEVYACTLIVLILVLLELWNRSDGFKLNILVVIVGENINNGYYACAPFFDTGFAEVAELYPRLYANATIRYIYEPKVIDCEESSYRMVVLLGKILPLVRQTNETMTVLLTPGCTASVLPLGDLARETKTTLVTTLGAAALGNTRRFPTLVSSTGSAAWQPIALVPFLEKFSWTTLTFLCDRLTKVPSIGSYLSSLVCPTLKGYLGPPKYHLLYEFFDSSNATNQSYAGILERAQRSSRIIVVATRGDAMRDIMIAAYKLNMTSDEYVYIYLEPTSMPYLLDLLDPTGDADSDKIVREAYRSLIVVNFLDKPWSAMEELLRKIADTARTRYNYTYNHGRNEQRNDAAMAAYEAVYVFSGLINETSARIGGRVPSPPVIRAASFDRLWKLPSRDVRTGSNGFRIRDISLSRYNSTSNDFEVVWVFNGSTRNITQKTKWDDNPYLWNGRTDPPSDIPVCGFDGTLCIDRFDRDAVKKSVAGVIPVILCLAAVAGFVLHRERRRHEYDLWWSLEPTTFDYNQFSRHPSIKRRANPAPNID